MKLCAECQKQSVNLKNSFTTLERIHLLASAMSMAGTIHHGRGISKEQDRIVNSSVITKLIWSIEPETRPQLLQYFRETVGIDIKVDNCPHDKLSVVS